MNFIEAAIFILFFATVSVPLANRLRLPVEIFLVIGSCIVSLLPAMLKFQLDPIVVFKLFLPPILFYAAYFTSWRDFKLNIRPISLLAFWFILFNTFVVAAIVKFFIPQFSWWTSLLLGAIVSPTDASAATTLIKRFGAPRRLVTILEGESLVNDATALLFFHFFVGAILTGSFSYSGAVFQFIVVATGGTLVGLVISYFAVLILHNLKDHQAETTLTFITAFTCYLIADHLGVSGVIATVVGGLYFGLRFPKYATSKTRINTKASWDTLMFVINGFVFTLIGLALPLALTNLSAYSTSRLVFYGILISVTVIVVRMIWIFVIAHVSRILIPSIAKKDPLPSWQALTILGWSGMRGIVSLAAALSIPYEIAPGIPFPYRDLLIFLTYCIIVVTLVVPSLSLPILLPRFHLTDTENKVREQAIARTQSLNAALKKIDEISKNENISANLLNEFRGQFERQLKVIQNQLDEIPYSNLFDEYFVLKRLALKTIESQREALIKLRAEGEIHDNTFHLLLYELDLEEMRIKSMRI